MNFEKLKFRKLFNEKVLGHTTGFLLAIAVLSPLMIWRGSVHCQATLAIAIEIERWDEALSIDPSNELANSERSKHQIKRGKDIDFLEDALTHLYQSSDSGSSTEELGDIFASGNIKLAKAYSKAGEVKLAEDALMKAQTHDASDRDLSDAKRFVAKACVESAVSLAQDGRNSAAVMVAKKGMGYDADVKIPAIVLEVLASDAVAQFKLSGAAQYRDAAVTAI
ncbi:hypothetical protein N9189_01860 [Pirellulaceae bacterium]|nr:hypothetical protein [Pirellulaceae bacterium]